VKSLTTDSFWRAYRLLAPEVREHARRAYRQFRDNPRHPGLQFKRVHPGEPIYSVRITLEIRAVGVIAKEGILWFWIGPHDEYERIIRSR
jgi:hypothetical protein